MSGSVKLPSESLAELFAHAREGYPYEVCGLVMASGAVRRCDNRQNQLHAEDPEHFPRDARTAYNIGPKDLMFLDRSQKSADPVRIIYHSHVDVGAYFSDEDVRAATMDGELLYPVDYLVVDVTKGEARVAKLFTFRDGKFVEIESYAGNSAGR